MIKKNYLWASFLLLVAIVIAGCKTSTDANSTNNFSADISYDGAAPVHYVSDDFHIHFNRVDNGIDTLIITADKGDADIFAEIFMELDSLHTGGYPVSVDAPYSHKGIRVDHTKDDGTFFTSLVGSKDSVFITDVDVAKQAVKGTFHCALYESGIQGGKKAEITNGTFNWNF